jgi:ribose transport system permease protein
MGRWFRSSRDIAGICVLLGLILMSTTNSYFLTTDNFDSIQTLIAVNGTLAVGMMVLLIGGFFDLSVGSVMGLAGIVCAVLLHEGFPIGLAIGMTLLFGAAVGMVNGFLVSRLQINPLIATLGTMFMGRGIIETIATTQTLTGFTGFPSAFLEIGAGKVFGIYLMFWIFLSIVAATHLALTRFAWGRQVFFQGSNPVAAHSTGFNTRRIINAAYCLMGVLSALAGVLMTARAQTANRYLGAGIELEIIVGCLIGGATTSGGRGTIAGAVIGTVFMALIRNSFVLYEIDPEWRTMALGGVLVGAVIWDAVIRAGRDRGDLYDGFGA